MEVGTIESLECLTLTEHKLTNVCLNHDNNETLINLLQQHGLSLSS